MRLEEILDKIAKEENLKDRSTMAIVKCLVEKRGREDVLLFRDAIRESNLQRIIVRGIGGREIPVRQLEHSEFFIILANSYAKKRRFSEAIGLFDAMFERGCNESTMLNDYGATLLNQMMAEGVIDKGKLDLARKLIFKAFEFDKKVAENWYTYPAYKNLCYLRDIEAIYYYNQNEDFAAFVLGWMSIEMTVRRIWFQFIKNKIPNVSKGKIESLMRWDIDSIIETLFLGKVDEAFKQIKSHLDTLRGIRNNLLHGKIDNPTHGNAKLCVDVAYKLIPILQ